MRREFTERIGKILPASCLLDRPEDLLTYSYDSQAEERLPELVATPLSTAQVSNVLALCNEYEVPVTPRGAGSGTTGGSVPLRGGLVLSLHRMNRILEIDTANFTAHVEPGVLTADLHKAVEAVGLFYPPDPASMAFSTIGGNIAENAGGMRAVKYGCTAAYVMGLEVVLADGAVISAGSKCMKDVVGFNLSPLFIGSEGMLGIVTGAVLRLLPLPETKQTARIAFRELHDAARAVNSILQRGIIPITMEFMDNTTINSVEAYLRMGLPTAAGGILLVEVDGSPTQVEENMARMETLCRGLSPLEYVVARTPEEQNLLWKARRSIPASLFRIRPFRFNEDIVVPRSGIPDMVLRIQEISARFELPICAFGHAGDGNIHVNVLFGNESGEKERAHRAVDAVFRAAVELEGRITGEHGVGLTKKRYLPLNVDAAGLRLMKRLKSVLDPKGILNPGKMFPDEGAGADAP
jgi:glycolate oxidase